MQTSRRLPSQLQSITSCWPVPHYATIVIWAQICKHLAQSRYIAAPQLGGRQTQDFIIVSLILNPLCHKATHLPLKLKIEYACEVFAQPKLLPAHINHCSGCNGSHDPEMVRQNWLWKRSWWSKRTLTSVPSTFTVATSALDVPMTKSLTTNVRAFIVESCGYLPPLVPLSHTNSINCIEDN